MTLETTEFVYSSHVSANAFLTQLSRHAAGGYSRSVMTFICPP